VISQKYALWITDKGKVAEGEPNEATLIAADDWNG
jgi:hypothetical protein